MACRHFHGTTGSPPPGTAHTPPRRPRWTVRPRSPSRTVADAHAAPPAAGQATASAALLSPQQPNPVVVPSTPRCSGCCDDQLNPPNTPRSPTAAACTPLASSLPWARSGMRWTTPSPRASSPPWNASCSTATPGRPEPGCARRSSISSRSSTTANAATRHSTTPAPSATSSSTYQQHPPPNHRVHESGATPYPREQALLEPRHKPRHHSRLGPPKAVQAEGPPKAADGSLKLREAHLRLGRSLSRRSPRRARSEREPASEAGGRVGVGPGLLRRPPSSESHGGAHSSSRLAPTTPTHSSSDEPHRWCPRVPARRPHP